MGMFKRAVEKPITARSAVAAAESTVAEPAQQPDTTRVDGTMALAESTVAILTAIPCSESAASASASSRAISNSIDASVPAILALPDVEVEDERFVVLPDLLIDGTAVEGAPPAPSAEFGLNEEELAALEEEEFQKQLAEHRAYEREMLEHMAQWCTWARFDMMERLPPEAFGFTDGPRYDILHCAPGRLQLAVSALFSSSLITRSLGFLCLSATNTKVCDSTRWEQRDSSETKHPNGLAYLMLIRVWAFGLVHELCRASDPLVRANMALALHLLTLHLMNLELLLPHSLQLVTHACHMAQHADTPATRLHAMSAASQLTRYWVHHHHATSSTSDPDGTDHRVPSLSSATVPKSLHSALFEPPPPGCVIDLESDLFINEAHELSTRISELALTGGIHKNAPTGAEGFDEDEVEDDLETVSAAVRPILLLPVSFTQTLLDCIVGADLATAARTVHNGAVHIDAERTVCFEAERTLHAKLTEHHTHTHLHQIQHADLDSTFSHTSPSITLLSAQRMSLIALCVLANLSAMPQHQPVLLASKALGPVLTALLKVPLGDTNLPGWKNTHLIQTHERPYTYVGRLLLQTLSNLSYHSHCHTLLTTTSSLGSLLLRYLSLGSSYFILPHLVYVHHELEYGREESVEESPYVFFPPTGGSEGDGMAAEDYSPPFGLDPHPDPRMFFQLSSIILSNFIGAPRGGGADRSEREIRRMIEACGGEAKEHVWIGDIDGAALELPTASTAHSFSSHQSLTPPKNTVYSDALLSGLCHALPKLDSHSSHLMLMALLRHTTRSCFWLERSPDLITLEALLGKSATGETQQVHLAVLVMANIIHRLLPRTIDDDTSPIHSASARLFRCFASALESNDPVMQHLALTTVENMLGWHSARSVLVKMQSDGGVKVLTRIITLAQTPDVRERFAVLGMLATFQQWTASEGGDLAVLMHRILPLFLPALLSLALDSNLSLHLHASRVLMKCCDLHRPDLPALMEMGEQFLQLLFRLLSGTQDLPLKLRSLRLLLSLSLHPQYQPSLVRLGVVTLGVRWMLDGGFRSGRGGSGMDGVWKNTKDWSHQKLEAHETQIPAQVQTEEFERLMLTQSLHSLRQSTFADWLSTECPSSLTSSSTAAAAVQVYPPRDIAMLLRNICVSVGPILMIGPEGATLPTTTTQKQTKKASTPKQANGITSPSSKRIPNGRSKVARPKSPEVIHKPSAAAYEVARSFMENRVLEVLMHLGKDPVDVQTQRAAMIALQAILPFAHTQFLSGSHHLPTRRTLIQSLLALLSCSSTPISPCTPADVAWCLDALSALLITEEAVRLWRNMDGWNVAEGMWRTNVVQARADHVQASLLKLLCQLWKIQPDFHLALSEKQLGLLVEACTVAQEGDRELTVRSKSTRQDDSPIKSPKASSRLMRHLTLRFHSLSVLSTLSSHSSYLPTLVRLGTVHVMSGLEDERDVGVREMAMTVLCSLLQDDAVLESAASEVDLLELLVPLSQQAASTRLRNLACSCLVHLAMAREQHLAWAQSKHSPDGESKSNDFAASDGVSPSSQKQRSQSAFSFTVAPSSPGWLVSSPAKVLPRSASSRSIHLIPLTSPSSVGYRPSSRAAVSRGVSPNGFTSSSPDASPVRSATVEEQVVVEEVQHDGAAKSIEAEANERMDTLSGVAHGGTPRVSTPNEVKAHVSMHPTILVHPLHVDAAAGDDQYDDETFDDL
jgi:hypothetical protein